MEVGAAMTQAILKYPGAKNRLARWIVSHIPPHKIYVEPFFGSGAVFFNKERCYNEIINDIDDDIYNFFKILRENPQKLTEGLRLTPYCRKEYEMAYNKQSDLDDIEKARRFAVKCWQGFGCGNKYKNGWRRGIGKTSPNPARAWSKLSETLELAVARLSNAQIEKKDGIELIRKLKGKDTFIYVDPPYPHNTRKNYLYNHEMTDSDHERLLETVLYSSCKIMVSSYENDVYETYLKNWRKVKKHTIAECSVPRTEVLYMNYEN
mgnify:FL=1